MEQRALKRARRLAAAFGVLGLVGVAVYLGRRSDPRADRTAELRVAQRVDARAPAGVRIKIEVLNASSVRGLARRATAHLRDRGFDVVSATNAGALRDSTLVIDRSGHPDWARLVGEALGGVPVQSRPDSSRYLDITVVLGADWRPAAEPFNP